MNYYGAKELAGSFRTVRNNTLIIANDIAEEHYGFRATPETRSVAETLVHIALIPRLSLQIHAVERRTTMEGFDFMAWRTGLHADEQRPRSKAEIIQLLQQEGDRFATFVESVSEDFLAEPVGMPFGQAPRTRFEMLLGVKEHEMHHRGQLMTIERMIGVVPHLTRQMQERMAAMQAAEKARA